MAKIFWFSFVVFLSIIAQISNAKSIKNKYIQQHPPKYIDDSYFLQITLNEENCEKTVGVECEFKDRFLGAPYFHPTQLTIYQGKIIAKQSYENGDYRLLKIRNNAYKLTTDAGNLISFAVTNGDIFDLKILQGSIKTETQKNSKCTKGKMLYDFYTIYKREDEIFQKTIIYSDEYDFDEVRNFIIFGEKKNQLNLMALSQTATTTTPITNIRLCHFASNEKSFVKHITFDECSLKINEHNEECFKYQNCLDHLAVENCEIVLFSDGFED